MFDLNEAIKNWRVGLAQSAALNNQDIEELEVHLREEYDELNNGPATPDEAFLLATRRLGNPSVLVPEYEKLNPLNTWRNRLFWMSTGILLWLFIGVAVRILFKVVMIFVFYPQIIINEYWILAILLSGLLFFGILPLYYLWRLFKADRNVLMRYSSKRFIFWATCSFFIVGGFISYLGLTMVIARSSKFHLLNGYSVRGLNGVTFGDMACQLLLVVVPPIMLTLLLPRSREELESKNSV